MAKMNQGILGGLSGKIANVVGSSWKGIPVLKSLPLSVANPKTAAQVTNREQFTGVVLFATFILATVIKPLLDRSAVKMSGYNLFVQLNKDLFTGSELTTPADLTIAKGTVENFTDLIAIISGGNDRTDITWSDNSGVGDALATDVVYGCMYNATKKEVIPIPSTATRADEIVEVATPADWDDVDVKHCFVAYRRADGSRTSDTNYALAST
jgi:hypothetical protein